MKFLLPTLAFAAALAGAAAAPAQPSGGPDAKGNAPLKPGHTVNDGAPKPGRNSFTEGQARTHIEKAGFTDVSNLVKGEDGVWRGQAVRGGQPTPVAMDFKGNVSTGRPGPGAPMAPMGPPENGGPPPPAAAPTPADGAMQGAAHASRRHAAHHRRHHRCAHPSANGAACSGVDRNANGVSDREDRAIAHGAHP